MYERTNDLKEMTCGLLYNELFKQYFFLHHSKYTVMSASFLYAHVMEVVSKRGTLIKDGDNISKASAL